MKTEVKQKVTNFTGLDFWLQGAIANSELNIDYFIAHSWVLVAKSRTCICNNFRIIVSHHNILMVFVKKDLCLL